jgi:hypothetical protein
MFERQFHVEGMRKKISLEIFEPYADDGAWICEYQLNVPGWDKLISTQISGVDKLQSVTSAIRRIRSDIAVIAERLGRQVTWLGEPRLDLI